MMRHIPNILTVGRLVITVVFLWLILYAPTTGKDKPADLLLLAFILFLIAGLSDIVDGYIARKYNATSKFGRTVDPLADKFLVCGAFICFAIVGQPRFDHFNFSAMTLHIIQWATAIIILVREVFVQTLRHIAEARGVNFAAVSSGKIKMFLQSFGIGTVLIKWAYVSREWGDWFTLTAFILLVVFTIYSGIDSLKRPIK
jgi:CDP-diacylglycerol--glycerol-3-phosphate 3-phosphatidyltransferase